MQIKEPEGIRVERSRLVISVVKKVIMLMTVGMQDLLVSTVRG
ncbi:hypothetical protein A2U01_0110614, partial [Trifolium medium]|nr:hypothetical protein [Trifolium medium]